MSLKSQLEELQSRGFKLCSAYWTGSSDNVYLSYIAIKDIEKWGSHKPFGGKDLYNLFYCFAGDISEFGRHEVDKNINSSIIEQNFSSRYKECTQIKVNKTDTGIVFTFTWHDGQEYSVRVQGDGGVYPNKDSDWKFLHEHQIDEWVYEAVFPEHEGNDKFLGTPEEVEIEDIIEASLSAKRKLPERIKNILAGEADSSYDLRSDQKE